MLTLLTLCDRPEVDIWSLGVILYALLTGSLPFDDDDEGIMRQLILDCKYEVPEWLEEGAHTDRGQKSSTESSLNAYVSSIRPADAASLVRSILVRDPLQRLSIKDILSHPFFTRPVASGSAAPSAPTSPSLPNYPSSIHSPGLGLSDAQTPDLALRTSGSGFFGPTPFAASPPAAHSLSEVQRGKQRASDPPLSHVTPPPPPLSLPLSTRGARPSALPPHLTTSPTPRIRRHPSTASIDFGPSAPAPSGQLFPPAMQRTSSAGAASINSLRIGMGATAGPGGGGAAAAAVGQKRRRSIGSLKSVRMQDVTEGEETVTLPSGDSAAHEVEVEGSRFASPRFAAASSAGSIDDEREESADLEGDEPPIDYVSLLLTTSAAPALLSTPDEQALLQQLTLLGFDAGQVAHSVRTSACDSCSAIWWMLRRKRELAEAEREVENGFAAGYETGGGEVGGEGKLSRTNSLRSVRRTAERVRDPAAVLYDSPDDAVSPPSRISMPLQRDDYLEILTEEQGPLSPLPTAQAPLSPDTYLEIPPTAGRARERTASTPEPPDREPSPPHTPPKRPSLAPATPAATLTSPTTVVAPATPSAKSPSHSDDAEARLSFFLNSSDMPATASSVGMLSYFPTVEGAPGSSPTSKRTMGLSQSISRDSLAFDAVGTQPGDDSTPDAARRERARSGSASLLARATSAIGHSLATLAQGGAPDDAETGESTPRQVPVKLPTTPKRATTAAPGGLNRANDQPVPSQFLRPPAVHASASAPPPTPNYSPSVSASPLPRATHVGVTALPVSPGRVPNRAALTLQSGSAGGTDKASSDLARSASSATSKKNKGGNLLTTFKHWFGQDPHKRKRASMSPRLGGPNSDLSSIGGVSVARSQSMYAGSSAARSAPLAIAGRPQMSSRKSSYNSAYTGAPASAGSATMSRRSSVSSAHRAAYLAENGTPLRAVRSRHRRLSDASRTSRTSLSERGDHSRPSSVRSLGGPGGSATRRHRHSTSATNSPSGSYVNTKEVYRRPPTTTTVRRRHGSRGRHSSDLTGTAARHHRRTASSTSSMHRSSSGSNIAGAGSDGEGYVDEDDVGEDPIMEEDEDEGDRAATVEASDSARDFARSRTLRTLTGGDNSPAASSVGKTLSVGLTLPRTSGSSPALSSTSASLRSSNTSQHHHHIASTFMAHKSTHLFGSPLQPHAPPASALAASQPSSLSRRATVPAHIPRRNVFAAKETNGEWIDEDDELAGYGGGLGQGNTASAGSDTPIDPAALAAPVSGPQYSPGLPGYADSPVASKIWGSVVTPVAASGFAPSSAASSSAARFENRYAGVTGAAASSPGLGADTSVFSSASGVGSAGSQAPPRWTQAAPVIEEDEEE